MSNVNVDSGGETSNVDNHATEENSTGGNGDDAVVAGTKADNEKGSENDSDTTPKPVSRPPYIPPHLMGRDLNDPAQDMVGTGRRVQKPRLGVKVPYRNLTSQIVSQDEIAQEILERSMRKYSYSEAEGGDVFFAMKLTHRLANKITPSVDSSNDKAVVGGGNVGGASSSSNGASGSSSVAGCSNNDATSSNVTSAGAMKKSETAEISIKCNAMNITTAVTEKAKETERKNDAIVAKKPSESTCKTSPDRCNDASNTDSCVNFESKADQLYAEISSTLGEECKLGKSLKIASPGVNSHGKTALSKIANGSINQATTTVATAATETELDNDTLLAILEGTSDISDVSMNIVASTPKLEMAPQIQQSSPPLQQQQIPQQQLSPQPPPQPQHQRKKRIKPMLDPNVEKELALKQLMDFEKKKNEDRLKKSAAKKLKLDEETSHVIQPLIAATISHINNNNNNNNINNILINTTTSGSDINNGIVDVSTTVSSAAKLDTSRLDAKPASQSDLLKNESAPSAKKAKKNTFSGGSVAPKRFPKKYQRIIKRQLRSSKLKAKTASPDQQQQQQQQTPSSQKKLPEVPEVQIAIDRYIKTYASKRKRKPETEPKEKSLSSEPSGAKNADSANSNAIGCQTNAAATVPSRTEGGGDDDDHGASIIKRTQQVRAAKTGDGDGVGVGDVNDNDNDNDNDDKAADSRTIDEEIKENSSPTTTKPKANSKVMREINRLLGDEGAINMIYSIEQKRLPDSKRDSNILPSLRRKKKDLLLKTKLVKNAVLRLSMSPGQLSPGRVRRTSPEISTSSAGSANARSATSPSRKASIESVESNASAEHSPKMRKVAAEASRIIRRHSSSSAYSSDEDENVTAAVKAVASAATEASKTKPVVHKSSAATDTALSQTATDAVVTKSVKSSSATSIEKQRPTTNDSNASHKINTRSSSSSGSGSGGGGGGGNEQRAVEETKNGECVENSASEREETVTGSSVTVASATTSKRKDSKETSVGVVAKTQNESWTVSCYSELVERLHLKEITLRKYDNLVQIILISSSCKMKNAMNIQVFTELTNVLSELQKDESCRTVLLTSTGSSFCQGIDLQALIHADMPERRKVVDEYITALLNFVKRLSQFKKVLIAGVHGSTVGLGVTMLPFFDMVFASDKATFYTPYVKLGQIPEAGATLTLPHLLGNAVTSELLFGCRMLTAGEALQFGLVTRILWPDKFGEELLPIARSVAGNSSQSMEATKSLLRQTMNEKLQQQLDTEAKLLRQHWSSDECQRRFKDYLQQEALLQNK